MRSLFGFGKKPDPKQHGPQLAPYQCPFPLSGEIVLDDNLLYVTASEGDFLKFRQMADTMEGFVLRAIRPDSLVWDKRVKGEPMVLIKAFVVLEGVPPELLWDVLHDPDYRAVWDDARIDTYLVKQLSPNCDIGYYGAKAQKPVYNRDFLNQRCWRNASNGEYLIFNTSVPHPKCPPQRGFVRAVSKISGYLIRPWGQGGTSSTLTYLSNSDPKGWIPSAFINMIISRFAPQMLQKIRNAAAQYPAWRAKQKGWVRGWETPPTPWAVPQPDETHAFFLRRLQLGEAASPVEALPDEETAEVVLESTPNEASPGPADFGEDSPANYPAGDDEEASPCAQ